MAPAFIEFNRRLRWADADAAGRLHFPRIFEIYQVFDTGEELAIEGTTTVVVLQNGKPTERFPRRCVPRSAARQKTQGV